MKTKNRRRGYEYERNEDMTGQDEPENHYSAAEMAQIERMEDARRCEQGLDWRDAGEVRMGA